MKSSGLSDQKVETINKLLSKLRMHGLVPSRIQDGDVVIDLVSSPSEPLSPAEQKGQRNDGVDWASRNRRSIGLDSDG